MKYNKPEEQKVTYRPSFEIYKNTLITIGTLIGGPLAAAYFIASNFKKFDEDNKVMPTWICGILAYIVFITTTIYFYDVQIIGGIVLLINAIAANYTVFKLQLDHIDEHTNAGGDTYDWMRTIGISVLFLGLSILVIYTIVSLK
jgi:hypothetical protein